ncbi:MAG TPA: MFS transporter [Actinomycetaceae bacterium]|nr:MFS transporter [Actinomycetaceae bacterium]
MPTPVSGAANPQGTEQMTRPERIMFAAGDTFGGGGAALISVLYLFYLTDIIGLPPAWAGFAVLVPKLWDAINDPLMGLLSDNARTRWGRRRPFIAVGASLLMVALAAVWAPIGGWESTSAKIAFVVGANLFYTTIATMIAVPYSSLSTEVTTNYHERNRINVMRLAFVTLAAATCSVLGTALLTAYTRGQISGFGMYLTIVFGFGTLFATPLLIAVALSKERAPIPPSRTSFSIRTTVAPFRLRSFRALLGMYLMQAVTTDVISALVVFYSLYVVKFHVSVFLGIFIVIQLTGFVVVNRLVRNVSKALVYRALIPLAIVGGFGMGAYPSDGPAWGIYAVAALVAIGMCGAVLMGWVMFPDVIDDAELATGGRNAGSFAGLMTLIRGLATAVTVQLIGLMLQVTGYRPPADYFAPIQPEAVQTGIRLTLGGAIMVFLALGWLAAKRYPLTYARTQEMQRELSELRAASAGSALEAARRSEETALD